MQNHYIKKSEQNIIIRQQRQEVREVINRIGRLNMLEQELEARFENAQDWLPPIIAEELMNQIGEVYKESDRLRRMLVKCSNEKDVK